MSSMKRYVTLSFHLDDGAKPYVMVLEDAIMHFCGQFPCLSPTIFMTAEPLLSERPNENIQQEMRALFIGHDLKFDEWSYLLPLVHTKNYCTLAGRSRTYITVPRTPGHWCWDTANREEVLEINLDVSVERLDTLHYLLHGMHKEGIDQKKSMI
ncbi:LOW QUALITY PROTEIN: hypothetical protein PHMEG_00015152 [Phytophthora megakarya]|uniref:Uncharacterized protein n=1 Tax=Phytophthora megakarya TaxID=4795 RepID=A0A225W2H2_9STRA|nr:LOW QUALITY PROTEIN: hypothetical protein PHMEG_00015152 [Phytophthora megakarya]